uniref:Uncharacterized protein n=1 Tax=Oryzias latipes TaxID=8090 RepID=A0A3P9JSV5_ORYLA
MYEALPQDQPQPVITRTLEDYTSEEVAHLVNRLRRKGDEPLDLWIVRLSEEGGAQTDIDGTDGLRFTGLSKDTAVDSNYRQLMTNQGEEMTTLFQAYARAITEQYAMPSDWPELNKPWLTIREGIQRLVRLCVREVLTIGMMDEVVNMPVPKAVRDAIIKTAPAAYKSLILTIMLGSPRATMGDIRSMMADVGSLGNWESENRPRLDMQEGCPPSRPGRGEERPPPRRDGGGGPSRRDIWSALVKGEFLSQKLMGNRLRSCEKCAGEGAESLMCRVG